MSRYTPGDPGLSPLIDALDLARRSVTRRTPAILPALSSENPTITITTNSSLTITGRAIVPTADTNAMSILGAPMERWVTEATGITRYSWRAIGPRYQFTPDMAIIEFDYTGQNFDVLLAEGQTTAAYWMWVDGRPIGATPTTLGFGASVQSARFQVAFSAAGQRRISLYLQKAPICKIQVEAGALITKPAPYGVSALFVGDSFVAGSSYNTGAMAGTWPVLMRRYLPISSMWQFGSGSTGYIATNSGNSNNYADRFTNDILPSIATQGKRDIGVMLGYYNDRAQAAGDLLAPMRAAVDGLRASANCPLVVGTPDPVGTNGSPYTTLDPQLKAVCLEYKVPYFSPTTGVLTSGTGASIYTTGEAWVPSAAAATALIGGDSVHGNDLWHNMVARRIAEAFTVLGY